MVQLLSRYHVTILVAQPIQFGGTNTVVEIDESKWGYKRKYHRGQVNPNHDWIFGMNQRDTRKVALIIVPNRGANDLIPLIQRIVMPGTTIMSDRWAAYNQLSTPGYRHLSVNHIENLIDPATGAHTQTIEGFWGHSKALFKSMRGGGG